MTDPVSPVNGPSVERSNTGGRVSAVAPALALVGLLIAGPVRGAVRGPVRGGGLRTPFVMD
jgi:hypothetical protein